ncbi:unnamed protein product [Adineta steineri]|uniref:Fork-head domain-containing protein n=1 Tax=Adineta steineri TaxID=433720 RepID=A0A815MFX7_9BILA|nr:unnamed protein product [Adineta steineri]CAF1622920.1 unnamed protein product [Adineta steineri]
MTQWPLIQRNVYTLASLNSPMNKTIEPIHVLTTHNTNTSSRISTTPNIYDDSLTNLSWLHDINILKRSIPTINSSTSSACSSSSGNTTISNKRKEQSLSNTSISSSSSSSSIGAVYPNDIDNNNNDFSINNDEQWRMYKTNPQAKPVYSYCQLILLAMQHSGYEKMTLQMIYEWISDNFPYFKKMEPTWQNSIRHNLSLNKCFIKVPRNKKETAGKGGYWKLSSDYERQYLQNKSLINNQQEQEIHSSPPNKRIRSSKRSTNHIRQLNNIIKSETWIDPILPCINTTQNQCHVTNIDRTYVRMPSSFLSPISSPDSLTVPSFNHHQQQQQINDFSSVLSPSPSSSPSSIISKQNFISTKLDDTDMLLLDSVTFDWDAYLSETPNDIDLSTKTEQDLFNDFNAALTDLTYSAETAAAGGDTSAFDGFDYPTKHSTFTSLFDDDNEEQQYQQSLKIKGRGIKRPSWWLTNDTIMTTKLPSLETAFDLKLSK